MQPVILVSRKPLKIILLPEDKMLQQRARYKGKDQWKTRLLSLLKHDGLAMCHGNVAVQ